MLTSVPKSVDFKRGQRPSGGLATLLVKGQGVFLFGQSGDSPCIFQFCDKNKANGLRIEFTQDAVTVKRLPTETWLEDPKCT